MIVYFVLYFFILWFLYAWYNYLFIKQKNFHTVGAVLACYITLGIILAPKFNMLVYSWQDVCYLFFIAIFALRWTFFDLFLNLMLGQKWYYIGETSKMDILTRKIGHWVFLIKIIILFWALCMCFAYGNIGVY